MIIQRAQESLLFITQPDHAALAEHIMRHWSAHAFDDHPRRAAILFAVREHDNGWIEEDQETHIAADGTPLDFTSVPAAVKHRIWPRAAERIGRDRRYEAALIAQHALTVHGGQRTDPEWRAFFDRMTRIRGTLMAALPLMSRGRFLADYRFVRIGDLLSLVFCNGWSEPQTLPDGRRTILKGATLEISPDPFNGCRVPLGVSARRLPARRYASAAELCAALEKAAPEFLEGYATGPCQES